MKNQKIKLFKGLGVKLITNGQKFLRVAFGIKLIKVSKADVRSVLMDKLGLDKNQVYLCDKNYYLTDWKTMSEIIEYDFTDQKKYLKDNFDCDDFSQVFKARLSEIYKLNSVGLARNIKLYHKDTNQELGWHRANIIVCIKNGVSLEVFAFEPMSDKSMLVIKNVPIVIGNWRWELSKVDM